MQSQTTWQADQGQDLAHLKWHQQSGSAENTAQEVEERLAFFERTVPEL